MTKLFIDKCLGVELILGGFDLDFYILVLEYCNSIDRASLLRFCIGTNTNTVIPTFLH
jgi:hypothetical protein